MPALCSSPSGRACRAAGKAFVVDDFKTDQRRAGRPKLISQPCSRSGRLPWLKSRRSSLPRHWLGRAP